MKKTIQVNYTRMNKCAAKGQHVCPFTLIAEPDKDERRWSKAWWRWLRTVVVKISWSVFSKAILGIVYFSIISEGLRVATAVLGKRLCNEWFLYRLADFEATYRVNLARCVALILLIAVWKTWSGILRLWLVSNDFFAIGDWNIDRHKQLVLVLGMFILIFDLCLFYAGLSQFAWGRSVFSFNSLVTTGSYFSVLIFVSYMDIRLEQIARDRRKELQS